MAFPFKPSLFSLQDVLTWFKRQREEPLIRQFQWSLRWLTPSLAWLGLLMFFSKRKQCTFASLQFCRCVGFICNTRKMDVVQITISKNLNLFF